MLKEQDLRIIGVKACYDKIGKEYCQANEESITITYGKQLSTNKLSIFVGIPFFNQGDYEPTIGSEKDWEYYCTCLVDKETGEVEIKDYKSADLQ